MLKLLKINLSFLIGLIMGSIIGTVTTIIITMNLYGIDSTILMYKAALCGG